MLRARGRRPWVVAAGRVEALAAELGDGWRGGPAGLDVATLDDREREVLAW